MAQRTRKSWTRFGMLGCGLALLVCCGDDDDDGKDSTTDPFKAAWIYFSPPGDIGWTYAHDLGRLYVEQELDNVTTTTVQNVSEADAQAEMQTLIDDGHKIIFTTTFGYMGATVAAAEANPDAYFEHCSGYETRDNMSAYFGRMYQARYLTGIVAGRVTQSNIIGIAAAHPIPEVIRHVNAIILGARSVNPDVKMHVEWVNAWYDPASATTATNKLISAGADVVFQDSDSNAPIIVADAASTPVYAVGYNSDAMSFAPKTVLLSAIWTWGTYYADRVKSARDGTWTSHNYWGGMDDGIVSLGTWGTADVVTQAIKDEVAAEEAKIKAGTLTVFSGEVLDQKGNVWVAAGDAFTDIEMLTMRGFVQGVVGTIALACDICVPRYDLTVNGTGFSAHDGQDLYGVIRFADGGYSESVSGTVSGGVVALSFPGVLDAAGGHTLYVYADTNDNDSCDAGGTDPGWQASLAGATAATQVELTTADGPGDHCTFF